MVLAARGRALPLHAGPGKTPKQPQPTPNHPPRGKIPAMKQENRVETGFFPFPALGLWL